MDTGTKKSLAKRRFVSGRFAAARACRPRTDIAGRTSRATLHNHMKLTNDSYVIRMGTKKFTETYYRDKEGWLKISARGRKFRMTAEQLLNHLLPAVAGVKPNLMVKVEYRPKPQQMESNA
jgi:hypothetical protein